MREREKQRERGEIKLHAEVSKIGANEKYTAMKDMFVHDNIKKILHTHGQVLIGVLLCGPRVSAQETFIVYRNGIE